MLDLEQQCILPIGVRELLCQTGKDGQYGFEDAAHCTVARGPRLTADVAWVGRRRFRASFLDAGSHD